MSSVASYETPKQSLEVVEMSCGCRIKWNIPIETFKRGFDVSAESTTLENSFFIRIKGVKNLEISLELIVLLTSDSSYMFSMTVCSNSNPEDEVAVLDYAFVVLGEEIYYLIPADFDTNNHPLCVSTLKEMESKGILSKGEIVPVHCVLWFEGIADFTLHQSVQDLRSVTIIDCEFVPQPISANMADLTIFYLDGKIPLHSIESAEIQLNEAMELDMLHVISFISNYLVHKLSKENVIKIMRIALKNNLTYLQNKVLDFMETNCKMGCYCNYM